MRSVYDSAIHKPLKSGAISAAQIHPGKRKKTPQTWKLQWQRRESQLNPEP